MNTSGILFVWILEPGHTRIYEWSRHFEESPETMGGRGQEVLTPWTYLRDGSWEKLVAAEGLTRDQLVEVVSHHHTDSLQQHLLHNQERLYHWSLAHTEDTSELLLRSLSGPGLSSAQLHLCLLPDLPWEHLNLGLPVHLRTLIGKITFMNKIMMCTWKN